MNFFRAPTFRFWALKTRSFPNGTAKVLPFFELANFFEQIFEEIFKIFYKALNNSYFSFSINAEAVFDRGNNCFTARNQASASLSPTPFILKVSATFPDEASSSISRATCPREPPVCSRLVILADTSSGAP